MQQLTYLILIITGLIAEFEEIVQLPPHVIVGDKGTGGVRDQTHRDACGQADLGTVDAPLKDDLFVVAPHLVTAAGGGVKGA